MSSGEDIKAIHPLNGHQTIGYFGPSVAVKDKVKCPLLTAKILGFQLKYADFGWTRGFENFPRVLKLCI